MLFHIHVCINVVYSLTKIGPFDASCLPHPLRVTSKSLEDPRDIELFVHDAIASIMRSHYIAQVSFPAVSPSTSVPVSCSAFPDQYD
jgi:hypothetical protein